MKKNFHILIANILFLTHCLLGVFLLIGWYFFQIKFLYLIVLLIWLSCWILLGYCPFTKWEFGLRRKYDKNIDSNAEAIKYYMNKFFKKNIPAKAIFIWGLVVFIILTALTLVF